jgi:hypothetical protein
VGERPGASVVAKGSCRDTVIILNKEYKKRKTGGNEFSDYKGMLLVQIIRKEYNFIDENNLIRNSNMENDERYLVLLVTIFKPFLKHF